MEGGAVGHIFGRDPSRDHPCQVWLNLGSTPNKQLSGAGEVNTGHLSVQVSHENCG
jgi:hypothetical protein